MHGPFDFPALPCPEGTRKGCSQAYADMQESVEGAANGFLAGNIVAFVTLGLMAAVLGFSGPKPGGDSDAAAAAKDDPDQV